MVALVSCGYKGEGADRYLVLIRDSPAGHSFLIESRITMDRGAAKMLELAREIGNRPLVEPGVRDELVFIEALHRQWIGSGKPQCAVGENALAVAHVTDHLANAPLVGRISMTAHRLG